MYPTSGAGHPGANGSSSNPYESLCLRCGRTVYQVDRVGPLKDLAFFHTGCFKCAVCGTRLTLRTYLHSQHDQDDKEVYCASHVPRVGPAKLDGSAVGIRSALAAPKSGPYVNEQIRAGAGKGTFDAHALNIRPHLQGSPTSNGHAVTGNNASASLSSSQYVANEHHFGRFDASALHIAHALRATEIQRAYKKPREKPIHAYLAKEDQTNLEMKHRQEEDDLYRKFARQREEEEHRMKEEIREEWEKELEKLTARFQKEMQIKKRRPDEQRVLTIRHQQDREDLEKNMTLRRDRRKESMGRKMLEHERAATAALVEKQSREMMSLIVEKRSEFMLEQSLYHDDDDDEDEEDGIDDGIDDGLGRRHHHQRRRDHRGKKKDKHKEAGGRGGASSNSIGGIGVGPGSSPPLLPPLEPYPAQPPPPGPPSVSKSALYSDPSELAHVDQVAISVAQEDQKTFTDLVRQLVAPCGSDVEKARTIFRWITVKNLNAMQFDEDVRTDTPMGLLRGIKHGTESYHVLFKRLCSYAGLHCVVIKGYSKSAGYQPGVRFQDSRFRNSWNAVYVAGAWRFVQCNWGARHLVNAKEAPKPGHRGKADSLRYEYDDHYFLTDPHEFIHEFFPLQEEWQLLHQPLTLLQFEELPFVRSLFFRYGLSFPHPDTCAVMRTDATGAATVRLGVPPHLHHSLIFHYNLKLCGHDDADTLDGVSLKRFVMQSVTPDSNSVAFRVHAPCAGAFLLDIFANAVTPQEYLTGEPMKFKSVCKFRIECEALATVMVPLPDCASGEWGPAKAQRLFGLRPLSHPDALIFAGRSLDIRFRASRPLADFMAALHKNGADERHLSRFVSHSLSSDGQEVLFRLAFPEEGQYGLDIYTREGPVSPTSQAANASPPEKHLLTHCCKYLINSSKRN